MRLPFTSSEFFQVFADYNETVWPAQILLLLVALVATALMFSRARWSDTLISALLAALWLWMGLVYHLSFFAGINPLAYAFAVLSLAGAAAFCWHGLHLKRLAFRWQGSGWNVAGLLLVVFSLAVYPVWIWQSGHAWPAVPTFGLPCPTTLFTIGMLAFMLPPYPRSVLLAPLLWCAIGLQAAFLLGVPPDLSLLAGGAVGGYKAGSAPRGVSAAILPSVIVGLLLWLIFALFDAPVLGLFGGLAIGVWALISSVGLLIGAAIGGMIAPDRGR